MSRPKYYNKEDWQRAEKWESHYHRLLTGHEYSEDIFPDFVEEVDKSLHINLDEYVVESECSDYGNYVVTMVSEDRRHCVIGICNDYQKKQSCFEIISW
jgi:hypothetical protein